MSHIATPKIKAPRQMGTQPPTGRILIVDDEERMTSSLAALLTSEGHDTSEAHSGEEAIKMLNEAAYDVVVADMRMAKIDGLEVLRTARSLSPDRPVIMMTGYASLDNAVAALNEGAYDYLIKPIDLTELRLTVRRAVERHRLHQLRSRLLTELREKNQTLSRQVVELNALHEVGAALSTTGELDKLLKAILNRATGVIGAVYGSIMLLTEEGNTMRVAATSGHAGDRQIAGEIPVGDSIAGRVIRTGESLMISDVEHDSRLARRNRPQFETGSLLCVPLKTPNTILGVINLSDKRNGAPFSSDDLRLLGTLAVQAAMAIEDSQNYVQVRRQLAEVTALHNLSNQLTAVERTDQMVEAVFSTLTELTHCDRVQWWEWQPDSESLVLTADPSWNENSRPQTLVSFPLPARDTDNGEICVAAMAATLAQADPGNATGSLLTIPVRSAEHPLGVFALHRCAEESFTEHEGRLVRLVASQAERIFERQRALLNASRLVTMGKMISEIAHDLRKPLTNIRGGLQVLQSRLTEDPEHVQILSDSEQEIVRLATLVSELVDFSNPKRYRTQRRDLAPAMRRAVSLIERAAAKNKITVKTDIPERLPAIFCEENQLIEAMLNVLMNAIEAMPDGGTLTVTAKAEELSGNESRLSISIADTGPGMSPAAVARVFERYYTTKSSGTGLGLPIVQRIITAHQGTIEAMSQPGEGTKFLIEFPVR